MRDVFCQALVRAAEHPDFVFLTGDLGFAALEPLCAVLGRRFINAGVAEQNMVSVAAGLAHKGFRPWVYSIAPFVYARPFEQIRNDICLHQLPVVLVGNGGGYGYGVMGATHHALEDYGSLLTLPAMRCFVPAFDDDVSVMAAHLMSVPFPAYLRLGRSEAPKGTTLPAYQPWRRLCGGGGATLLVVGPLVGGLLEAALQMDKPSRPSVWLLAELPIEDVPAEFVSDIARSQHLVAVEEHVPHGGAGQMLAHRLAMMGVMPRRFEHRAAHNLPAERYGSQKFHRRQCGLDAASIFSALSEAGA